MAGERQHLIDEDATAQLDAQILGGDQFRDGEACHGAPLSRPRI
jgi:hypothetical protein